MNAPTTFGTAGVATQEAVTAAAGMGEEPVVRQVTFAITGIPIADALCGINAVLNNPEGTLRIEAQLRLWEMLAALARDQIKENEERQRQQLEQQRMLETHRAWQQAGSLIPETYKGPPNLVDFTTSSGTVPSQISNSRHDIEALMARIRADMLRDSGPDRSGPKPPSLLHPGAVFPGE